MTRVPKPMDDDRSLLLSPKETQELQDILAVAPAFLGANGGAIVMYQGKRRNASWLIRKIERFHDKMERARASRPIPRIPLSKIDMELAERCLQRLEKRRKP